jgi:hypothetical protein
MEVGAPKVARPSGPTNLRGSQKFVRDEPKKVLREDIRAKPVSGGQADTERVRIVRGYYSNIADQRIQNLDMTDEQTFDTTLNQDINIFTYNIPEARVAFIDSIVFFARPMVGVGLIPAGIIEGAVECYLSIGGVVPLTLNTVRAQPGVRRRQRSFVPFLNQNVGPTQFNFSLQAKTGQQIRTYYRNIAVSPLAVRYIGARIRGWIGDVSIIEEILEQQR